MFKKNKLALGVLQRTITYIDGFPRWGCYVACILTAIQRSLQRNLYPHEIQQWYNECVRRGAILCTTACLKRKASNGIGASLRIAFMRSTLA